MNNGQSKVRKLPSKMHSNYFTWETNKKPYSLCNVNTASGFKLREKNPFPIKTNDTIRRYIICEHKRRINLQNYSAPSKKWIAQNRRNICKAMRYGRGYLLQVCASFSTFPRYIGWAAAERKKIR